MQRNHYQATVVLPKAADQRSGAARLRGHVRRLPRIRLRAGVLASLVLAAAVAGCAKTPAAETSSDTKGGPDLAFYNGKTITLLGGAVGSTPDLITRAVIPYMEKYLHATIIDQNQSANAANGVNTNQAVASAPDGLTITVGNLTSIENGFYENNNPLTYNPLDVSFISGFGSPINLFAACAGSPYKSWAQVISSTTPVKVVSFALGTAPVPLWLMLQAYNTPSKFINGYESTTQVPGCARGDGDVAVTATQLFENSAKTALVPGVNPLMLLIPIPKGSASVFLNKEVGTLAQFVAQHPANTAQGEKELKLAVALFSGNENAFYGPLGIPKDRLLALSDAAKYAFAQPAVEKTELNLGVAPGSTPPTQVPQALNAALSQVSNVRNYLKNPTHS
jgi:tripartite-type tricarboxylate transporter receptor subunit TctC